MTCVEALSKLFYFIGAGADNLKLLLEYAAEMFRDSPDDAIKV